MAILTVNDLKTKYNIKGPSDEQLEELLEVAEDRCFAYAGIESGEIDEYFNGGTPCVALTHGPVVQVKSVEIAGSPAAYRFEPRAAKVVFLGTVPAFARDSIKVSYECGWLPDQAPKSLRAAVGLSVQHLVKLINSKQIGVTSRSVDGGTEQLEQSIPTMAVKSLLSRYITGVI